MTTTLFATLALLGACGTAASDEAHQLPAPAHAATDDTRTPVPLTPMMANHQKRDMRDHLRVVQEITAALASDDFESIAAAANRIGWSEQQAAKCKHMGAGAPGFAALGEQFHRSADTIVASAHRHDHAAVIQSLDKTLQFCVSCHATYRQEIAPPTADNTTVDENCPMHGK